MLQESLQICDRIGYDEGAAWPLTLLGQARLWAGDESDEVRTMLEDGRRLFIAIGDPFGQMHANMFIPNVGDQGVEAQLRYAQESVELADRPGADPLIRPAALHNLSFSLWNDGKRERAIGLNRISARSALEMGVTINSAMAFLQAGLFAGVGGDSERSAMLFGAGDRHFVMQMAPFYNRQLQPGRDAATDALGKERYQQSSSRSWQWLGVPAAERPSQLRSSPFSTHGGQPTTVQTDRSSICTRRPDITSPATGRSRKTSLRHTSAAARTTSGSVSRTWSPPNPKVGTS